MFCSVPTARVIFLTKTNLDAFSFRREHVWTCSILGDNVQFSVIISGDQNLR